MTLRCKPGDLAIVIRSECGNEGREVHVVRWLNPGEQVRLSAHLLVDITHGVWLVDARYPLRNSGIGKLGFPMVSRGFFPDDYLLPITPPDKALDEDIHAPIDCEVLTS